MYLDLLERESGSMWDTLLTLADLIDKIVYSRPIPRREYDQIYMRMPYMIKQLIEIDKHAQCENMAFLGDGDSMCIFMHLAARLGLIDSCFNHATIFDFDERVLRSAQGVLEESLPNANDSCIRTVLYNIVEPIPTCERSKYDYFYINPPYGSKNNGLSVLLWIYRCMALISDNAKGCIILSDDSKAHWTMEAKRNIIEELGKYGFRVDGETETKHLYHLSDNPSLNSTGLLVSRETITLPPYIDDCYPLDLVRNLYGEPRGIPHFIKWSDSSPIGEVDLNWSYGDIR